MKRIEVRIYSENEELPHLLEGNLSLIHIFIPVVGMKVGDTVDFGGLLGYAPIMSVNQFSCSDFVNRVGRIPAPIHSFKN